MQWTKFFGARQGECVSEYITKCTQPVTGCASKCPQCSKDLSEYLLLRKSMGGLCDVTLKQQVYQACDSMGSVDVLRAMCCAYEAARRDAAGGGTWREVARAAGTATVQSEAGKLPPTSPLPQLAGNVPHDAVAIAAPLTPSGRPLAWRGRLFATAARSRGTTEGAAGVASSPAPTSLTMMCLGPSPQRAPTPPASILWRSRSRTKREPGSA